jgi:hypothetical protein
LAQGGLYCRADCPAVALALAFDWLAALVHPIGRVRQVSRSPRCRSTARRELGQCVAAARRSHQSGGDLNDIAVSPTSTRRQKTVRRGAIGQWRRCRSLARLGQNDARPGTTIALTIQPISAMPAEIVKFVSKVPCAMASPPTSEPSEMPQKSALLFQASAALRWQGKSFARPAC